jgi:divinyl chlorophyllide a 8-vinyl-reductase
VALVRSLAGASELTRSCLEGAIIVPCDLADEAHIRRVFEQWRPSATICCVASRTGFIGEARRVDYGAGRNLLQAQESTTALPVDLNRDTTAGSHFVLLSAFCCGKPKLQFQFAKLKLEQELAASRRVSHSVVRPTAYFKSLDGQVESANRGLPLMHFGSGSCAANAISERDLARFLVDCALDPASVGMLNSTRNVGGPDVPPVTKREQLQLLYDALRTPPDKQWVISLPLRIFDVARGAFASLEDVARRLGSARWGEIFLDAQEVVKIVHYYATEPMVATGPGEVVGSTTLKQHFEAIAARGGLEECDAMTTTTGLLGAFSSRGGKVARDAR